MTAIYAGLKALNLYSPHGTAAFNLVRSHGPASVDFF